MEGCLWLHTIYCAWDIGTLKQLWGSFKQGWQPETMEHHNDGSVIYDRLQIRVVMEKTKDHILGVLKSWISTTCNWRADNKENGI